MKIVAKILVLFVISLQTTCSLFAVTKSAGYTSGLYLNKAYNTLEKQALYVYIDEYANTYFKAKDCFMTPTGYVNSSQYKEVIGKLEKGLEWAEKVRVNKIETTKLLDAYFIKANGRVQGINLTFISLDKGKDSRVLLGIKDFNNQFAKCVLCMNMAEVKELISILKKVPETYKELVREQEKADILN